MLTQGYPDTFEYVWDRISTEFGDIAAEGGWFAITNNVVEGSRRLPISAQQELVKTMGCDIPGLLELTSVAILVYLNSAKESPTRLYPWEPIRVCRSRLMVIPRLLGASPRLASTSATTSMTSTSLALRPCGSSKVIGSWSLGLW